MQRPLVFKKILGFKRDKGFSITDVVIAMSIAAIISAFATPNLKMLVKGYKLRSASNDLVAFIQITKIRAAKTNETWTINFNPTGYIGYEILDGLGRIVSSINFGICSGDSIVFERCYDGDIQYIHPESGMHPYNNEIITFSPNGITSEGYISISDNYKVKYYRIRIVSASGIVRSDRWNGTEWK